MSTSTPGTGSLARISRMAQQHILTTSPLMPNQTCIINGTLLSSPDGLPLQRNVGKYETRLDWISSLMKTDPTYR